MKTETLVKKTMQKSNITIKNKVKTEATDFKLTKISKSPARHQERAMWLRPIDKNYLWTPFPKKI